MGSVAEMVMALIEAGAPPEIAAQVVAEAYAAGASIRPPTRTARQDRNRRYYENRKARASEERLKASDSDVSDGVAKANIQHAPTRGEDNPSRLEHTGEKKNTPSVASPAKRGTRIPDDWQPDMLAARREGLSQAEAEREAERFRDYYLGAPNAKGVKLDWPATWRNWCRNAVDRRQARGADPPKRGSAALIEALETGRSQ